MTDPTPADPTGPMSPPEPAPAQAGDWAASPPPVQAGPAGFVYADVPNRAVAYIIDAILVGIVSGIVYSIIWGITGANIVGLIVSAIAGAAISAAYFIYTWTSMRATVGMKVLSMQVGNAGDGKTLTTDQAIRRWLVIAAPSLLAQVFLSFFTPIGYLLSLASLGWFIYLVYTTAKSPTKQGYHDVFANTMVVKAARNVG